MLRSASALCYLPTMKWLLLLATLMTSGAKDVSGPEALTRALAREEAGDNAAALAGAEAAVRANPSWALARLELARLLLKTGGSLEHAAAHLDAAAGLAPDNPRVHYLRGLVWEERGEPSLAQASYQTAVELRPSYEDPRLRLAGLSASRGDWARAELHYRFLSRTRPESVQVRTQLALALERQGRLEEAEEELVALYALQPGNALVARRLADLYERTERPRLAEKVRKEMGQPPRRKLRELKRSRR